MTAITFEPKDADEIKKIAEARKAEAEARLAEKEIELRDAEIRQTIAEAIREEQQAVVAGISRNERERMEDLTKTGDFFHFRYNFEGVVNEKTVFGALNTANTWHRLHPDSAWDITINSPGGSVIDGFHLFDELLVYSERGKGSHHITMTVRGEAASMAGILLQVADERVMGLNAQLLIHQISSWSQGSIGAIKDDVKRLDMLQESVINLFVKRSKGKISRKEFEKLWERRDWWLSADEALKYGFIDRIG